MLAGISPCDHRSVSNRAAGFTLIELISVMLVFAILAVVAVPAMISLVQGNAMRGAEQDVVTALTLARSEAIARNTPVAICASSDGSSCVGTGASNWQQGWIVFTDAGGTAGVVDTGDGDAVLRVNDGVAFSMTLRYRDSTSADRGVIRFAGRTGKLVTAADAGEFRLCHSDADASDASRILLGATGRATLDDDPPTACP